MDSPSLAAVDSRRAGALKRKPRPSGVFSSSDAPGPPSQPLATTSTSTPLSSLPVSPLSRRPNSSRTHLRRRSRLRLCSARLDVVAGPSVER